MVLGAIGENDPKLGQPHVGAVLGDEPFHVVAPAPVAGLAQDLDRRLADVGQGDRVAGMGLELAAGLGTLWLPANDPGLGRLIGVSIGLYDIGHAVEILVGERLQHLENVLASAGISRLRK